MSRAPDHLAALAALARAIERAKARWYLFGAQAVVLYGVPRATADLDVTVEADPENFENLRSALLEEGIAPRIAEADALLARARVLLLEHRVTGVPIDMVFAGPGLEAEFLDHARWLEVAQGQSVRVISPTDLVVAKVLAGRPKDLDDARGVVATCGHDLDVERARSFLRLLEQALDRSDLVAEFDRMLGS